jgi:Lsr2
VVQKLVTELVSDLDGSEADETVAFGLDGTGYEIDLSGDQAAGLRQELSCYVEKARKAKFGKGKAPGRAPRTARPDLPEIRDYARERGYKIKDRGRVPGRIVAEYDALKQISGT